MSKVWVNPNIEHLEIKETAKPGKGKHNGIDTNLGNHYGWGSNVATPAPDFIDALS